MPRRKNPTDAVVAELRAFGLAYPETHTKSPWPGHLDLAVKDKTFAFLSAEGEPLRISCKLPHSHEAALLFPFAKPTPYGLGRSGWVSAEFEEGETPPVDLLKSWIDESYRALAPKKLVASLPAVGGSAPVRKVPAAAAAKRKVPAAAAAAKRKAPAAAAAAKRKVPPAAAAAAKRKAPAAAAAKRKVPAAAAAASAAKTSTVKRSAVKRTR
ncbi:MmcQ/YjbR family DNA-binding protein [Pendulispora albinea]|uniref:MmcQ/YjbR family DNA-binding protein n=1 Tax=Pendulispora albinea TaxID=2741071 RepID=A0ABZ2M397_9BACT